MARFLSPEWVTDLDAAARASSSLAASTKEVELTIEQVIRNSPAGEVRYQIEIDRGRVRVLLGHPATPDVTLTTDYETACAIARGETNAQHALVASRMKVTGRMDRLLAHGAAVGALDDVFATVRASTTYV